MLITQHLILPTLSDTATMNLPISGRIQGSCERAAHLVQPRTNKMFNGSQIGIYMAFQHARFTRPICYHNRAVGSYSTFSPLPLCVPSCVSTTTTNKGGGNFLWHCL